MIPLLKIPNGEQKWYFLKDETLQRKACGDNPQILLEMCLCWNPIRASLKTFQPKQMKYVDKSDITFKFGTFTKNVNRIKAATDPPVLRLRGELRQ